MAIYKMVNADQLDSDLALVADSIRSKGGTSEQLAFPDGFKSAVDAISTGATIQRKSDSFTTSSSGTATVNCGFKPDAVFIYGSRSDDASNVYYAGVPFLEYSKTSMKTYLCGSSNSYPYTRFTFTQTNSGFSVSAVKYSASYSESNESNRTINYVAVKYS